MDNLTSKQVCDYLDRPPQRYAHQFQKSSGSREMVEDADGAWVKFEDMDLYMFEGAQLIKQAVDKIEQLEERVQDLLGQLAEKVVAPEPPALRHIAERIRDHACSYGAPADSVLVKRELIGQLAQVLGGSISEPPTASLIDHIRANKELADNNMELRGLLREARPYIESFSRLTKLETAEIDALKLRDQIVAALRGPETKPASCAAFTPYPGDPDLCAHCNKARSSHETRAFKPDPHCPHGVIEGDYCGKCKEQFDRPFFRLI